MFKLAAIWNHLKQMKGYIVFSFMLFFAGIVIGSINSAFHSFLDSQLAGIGELAQKLQEADNPALAMLIVIFLNNAIKAIFIMYLGLLFGVFPLFFLVMNGMLIGYLLNLIAETPEAPSVLSVIFKGLLPHGIIEIPAIVLACAYGMKLGVLSLQGAGNLLFARSRLGVWGKQFQFVAARTVPIIVILTVSLLIAAIVESTLTVWLLAL